MYIQNVSFHHVKIEKLLVRYFAFFLFCLNSWKSSVRILYFNLPTKFLSKKVDLYLDFFKVYSWKN